MVSIHIVPIAVILIISIVCLIFRFKRGTVCPIFKLKVLRKPGHKR